MTESTSNGVPGTLTPGQTVGKYEIRDLLGAGGQSVVYRAWDSALEREVALKQMTPNLIADPKYADQIRKTIRTIATLGAKNEVVVTIYDLIEEERGMFYAMEYVDGHSLELVLHDNPGPVEVKGVLLILFRLAAALHEIHGAGIIHRDLKPSNIMLAEGLRPKIIDFGVASIGESDVSMPLVTTKYLAPELYEGGACDSRADIYSLGFIIYEMLLGREKFNEIFQDIVRDKHAEALRWMKWHGNAKVSAPPAHEVVPTVPLALSHIVQRMIEKDPEQRFASTEELGRTIKRSFSGKKRGAGAVAPAPAQAQRSAMMARLAAERGLGRLEDEVDYTPAGVVPAGAQAMGPATAPMPKEPMGKKKKIALAVAASLMFVVFAGLVIYKVQQDKQRQISLSQTARGVLTKGCTALETGKYTDSIKLFTTLLENHKGTIEAKHAEYLKPLAEGYVAHSKGDYTRARQLKKDVIIITERLVPTFRNENDRKFVSKYIESAEALSKLAVTSDLAGKAFARATQSIKAATTVSELGQCEQQLKNDYRDSYSGGALPTKVEDDRYLELLDQIKREKCLIELKKKFAAAQKWVDQEAWPDAELSYQAVEDFLESDAAKSLSQKERDEKLRVVNQNRKTIAARMGKQEVLDRIEKAEINGNPLEIKAAYRAATKSDKFSTAEKARYTKGIAKIDLDALIAKAKAALEAGDASARDLCKEVLLKDPQNTMALEALAGMDQAKTTEALRGAAKRAVQDGNYADGLALLEKLSQYRQDDEVRTLMTQCRYELTMEEARRAIRTGNTAGALRLLGEAEQIDPTKAALVGSMRNTIQSEKKYAELVIEIKASMKAETTKRTLELIVRARQISDTQELTDFENQANYNDKLAAGKKALNEGNRDTARWYFKLAQRYMDTKEIQGLIDQVKPITEPAATE